MYWAIRASANLYKHAINANLLNHTGFCDGRQPLQQGHIPLSATHELRARFSPHSRARRERGARYSSSSSSSGSIPGNDFFSNNSGDTRR
jgi:hypothetical protein